MLVQLSVLCVIAWYLFSHKATAEKDIFLLKSRRLYKYFICGVYLFVVVKSVGVFRLHSELFMTSVLYAY